MSAIHGQPAYGAGMRQVMLIVLAMLPALLGGCSGLQIGYNNAGLLARYMIHDYVDLDPAQDEDAKARLAALHSWHRGRELPAYLEFLRSARARAASGVQPGDAAWGMAVLRRHYRRLAVRAAEEASPLLVNLSPEQIDSLERNLAKKNAKFAGEFITGDEKKLLGARAMRMRKSIEEWTGNLTPLQRMRIERFVQEHALITELRFQDRQRWQRRALALIRTQRAAAVLGPRLAELFAYPEKAYSPLYLQETRRWEEGLAQLAVDLDRSLSAEQRLEVLRQADKITADLTELSGSGKPRLQAE